MGFSIETSVPMLTVFFQGVLSFLSPCVLPLLPLYISYLAGGAHETDKDGNIYYPRKKTMLNTIFFVIGISFAFFLLGFGFTAIGRFFSGNRMWFARISGIIMILFGLYQFGVFGSSKVLSTEKRIPFNLDKFTMGPLTALLLGFTFSFAWTPCVGPTLGSVLLMTGSSKSSALGFALIGVYTLGFVLPFLAVGLFTDTLLGFFKSNRNVVKYSVKIGAALLIIMGIMTLTGFLNGVTDYLSKVGNTTDVTTSDVSSQQTQTSSSEVSPEVQSQSQSTVERDAVPAPDFTLTDQNGVTHTLSDYKGKTVFLNFWATWCGPCRSEMPDIQALYEKYNENADDLVVLGVAAPNVGNEGDATYIADFLKQNGYAYPVVMDENGTVSSTYGISAYPTTFMIDKDGNLFGYVTGALSADVIDSIVQQTITGERAS